MGNPFANAARELAERHRAIEAEKRAAEAATRVERLEYDRLLTLADELSRAVRDRMRGCVIEANRALDGTGVSLTMKSEPLQTARAARLTVLLRAGGRESSFRIEADAQFRLSVHGLSDPTHGPFRLEEARALPCEDMIEQLMRSATQDLGGSRGGASD